MTNDAMLGFDDERTDVALRAMNGYTAGGTVLQYLMNSYTILNSRTDDERQLIATALLGGGRRTGKRQKKGI